MSYNGYVYETFGISKHLPVKLQVPLIRAETLDNPLTAKCFIYDVSGSAFISIIILFLSKIVTIKLFQFVNLLSSATKIIINH